MSHDENEIAPSGSSPLADDSGTVRTRERRKRYPGILSKVAAGAPENAAMAVLKGELALPAQTAHATPEQPEALDDER
jgi:hypothetical protein